MEQSKVSNNNKQLNAAFWYTISNFLVSGIMFLVTPIFTRLMSVSEYGEFSTYNSYRSIIIIITTLSLSASINRARFDFKSRFNDYIFSIAMLSIMLPMICYLVVFSNINFFSTWLGLSTRYIHVLFLSIIFSHVFDIFLMKNRVEYEYKTSVYLSLSNCILTVTLSLLFVFFSENKVFGRMIGQMLPVTFAGIGIFLYLYFKSKSLSWNMIRYALIVSTPFVPHLLAGVLLSQSDKVLISQLVGNRETGIYSIGCTCSMIILVLLNSINAAWSPWLGDKIHNHNCEEVKHYTKIYCNYFFFVFIGAILFAPELVLLYGGIKYYDAVYVVIPLITSIVFQFIYTQYVNILQFEKKVWRVAGVTIISALINILLNLYFIPQFGYIVAAYTTLLSYALMSFMNYICVKSISMNHIYDNLYFLKIAFLSLLFNTILTKTFQYTALRFIFCIMYVAFFLYLLLHNKNRLLAHFKRK